MSKKTKYTGIYVTSIVQDIQTRFVKEETTKYSEARIERVYEFEDGAVVKYEWKDFPMVSDPEEKRFNHRFTLVTPPKPNPNKIQKGVIKVINYSGNSR